MSDPKQYPSVYLAGPINGKTDEQAKGWRAKADELLRVMGYVVFDPMVRDYRGREHEPGIAEAIVVQDKADIREVDILLVWYEEPSVGTSMEVLYASQQGKRVVVIDKTNGKRLSPWLTYHATDVVNSLAEALQALGPAYKLFTCCYPYQDGKCDALAGRDGRLYIDGRPTNVYLCAPHSLAVSLATS